jgi:hypothetical protein
MPDELEILPVAPEWKLTMGSLRYQALTEKSLESNSFFHWLALQLAVSSLRTA